MYPHEILPPFYVESRNYSTVSIPQHFNVVFIAVQYVVRSLRPSYAISLSRVVLWQCVRAWREDSRARVTAVTKYRNRILLTLASADNHRSPENHQFMSTPNVKGAQLRKSSVSGIITYFDLQSVYVYTIIGQQWTLCLPNQKRRT